MFLYMCVHATVHVQIWEDKLQESVQLHGVPGLELRSSIRLGSRCLDSLDYLTGPNYFPLCSTIIIAIFFRYQEKFNSPESFLFLLPPPESESCRPKWFNQQFIHTFVYASIVSPAKVWQEASDIKTHFINEDFPPTAVDYLLSSLSIMPHEQRKNCISWGCVWLPKCEQSVADGRKCWQASGNWLAQQDPAKC